MSEAKSKQSETLVLPWEDLVLPECCLFAVACSEYERGFKSRQFMILRDGNPQTTLCCDHHMSSLELGSEIHFCRENHVKCHRCSTAQIDEAERLDTPSIPFSVTAGFVF